MAHALASLTLRDDPIYYECQFDVLRDDWSAVYLLKPLDEETFQLLMEDWDIWSRWRAAFEAGTVSQDTHPALPENRERHMEIETLLKERLIINPERDLKAEGKFEVAGAKMPGQRIAPLRVKWSVVS